MFAKKALSLCRLLTFLTSSCFIKKFLDSGNKVEQPLQARWLTLANRLLGLYVSTKDPSIAMLKAVRYILNVMAPTWFYMRRHQSFTEAPKSYWFFLRRLQKLGLDEEEMAIFETCLTNNSSPIHQENIILCALTDPYKPENRCKAVEAIKFIRAEIARKVAEARLSEQVDVGRVPMYKWGKLLPDRFLLPSARR